MDRIKSTHEFAPFQALNFGLLAHCFVGVPKTWRSFIGRAGNNQARRKGRGRKLHSLQRTTWPFAVRSKQRASSSSTRMEGGRACVCEDGRHRREEDKVR